MKYLFILLFALIKFNAFSQSAAPFTLDELKSYPFPNELTASPTGARIAWAFQENGRRNVYVAEGPSWEPRRITTWTEDDGQEITSLQFTSDGARLIFVRGGDHGSNWDDHLVVNTRSLPNPPKVQIMSIPFEGGDIKVLGDGEDPVVSSRGVVAFHKGGQIWTVPADGSSPATQLFTARGSNTAPEWSPDGSRLAFQSNRQDHAYIGVFTDSQTPILWLGPSFNRDGSPRWSPDGKRIAFIRQPGAGGKPDSVLRQKHNAWSIAVGQISDGAIEVIWKAPVTLRGSLPTTHGGTNLHWADGRIVFLSYADGWPHLYSIRPEGGNAELLTTGNFMAEHIRMSPDRRNMVFSANTGKDPLDIDRRHVVMVQVDKPGIKVLTPGAGLEWTPVIIGDGKSVAFLRATAQRSPLPAVMDLQSGNIRTLAENLSPLAVLDKLVTPRQVVFRSPDGFDVHCQWFEAPNTGKSTAVRKPAIIYIHGGPPRQMLLGWHYSDYYSNAYAMNQYLASRGFVVLSVNYRLGIGYGHDFHHPANAGTSGASEYTDIRAAAEWLSKQSGIDAARIGVYGGSYGGYLTAMALARDSKLFAAGVDIHGVHDRTIERTRALITPDKYERAPDADAALEVAWKSSPIAYMDGWKSPVLVIHGDDDRNVRFSQSTDLVRRLEQLGIPHETLVIVDDTHHFMLHSKQQLVNKATAGYLERKLK